MKKVLIIDDEPLARMIVKEFLDNYSDIEVVQECENGFDGLKAIHQHHPDLVFLDVQMPKITGFEMLELLDYMPSVIFTTAFDEYALKAFETHAIDYLLKPFSQERFDAAMRKWQERMSAAINQTPALQTFVEQQSQPAEEHHRIVVKNGANISIIPFSDIHSIEAYDDYVKIFTAKDYFLKKKTMSFFESVLPQEDFVRVHRSHIVQIKCITKIEPYEKTNHIALLSNGRSVPLSRSGYSRLKETLGV
jgi:two-component system, LytTR family, response regulator